MDIDEELKRLRNNTKEIYKEKIWDTVKRIYESNKLHSGNQSEPNKIKLDGKCFTILSRTNKSPTSKGIDDTEPINNPLDKKILKLKTKINILDESSFSVEVNKDKKLW